MYKKKGNSVYGTRNRNKSRFWYSTLYIFEEIVEYIEQTAQGKSRYMKWENIKSLLRCAVINKRLTERQAEHIESQYCREKNSKEN